MRRSAAVLAIALAGVRPSIGLAQDTTTANDLFAAYCLGVLRSSGILLNQALEGECAVRKGDTCDWVSAAIGQRSLRLDAILHYLEMRGLSIAPDSARPLVLLADSGRQDSQRCLDWQLAEPGRLKPASIRPPFCQRQDLCSDLDRLTH